MRNRQVDRQEHADAGTGGPALLSKKFSNGLLFFALAFAGRDGCSWPLFVPALRLFCSFSKPEPRYPCLEPLHTCCNAILLSTGSQGLQTS